MEARAERDKMAGKVEREAMEKIANWDDMAGAVDQAVTAALVVQEGRVVTEAQSQFVPRTSWMEVPHP